MTVFDDPRVRRCDVVHCTACGNVWAVVYDGHSWFARRSATGDDINDLGPFDTAEAAIKAVFEL